MNNFKIIDNINSNINEYIPDLIDCATDRLYILIGYSIFEDAATIFKKIEKAVNRNVVVEIIFGNLYTHFNDELRINKNLSLETYKLIKLLYDKTIKTNTNWENLKIVGLKEQNFDGKFYLSLDRNNGFLLCGSLNSTQANRISEDVSYKNFEYNFFIQDYITSDIIADNIDWFEQIFDNNTKIISNNDIREIDYYVKKNTYKININEYNIDNGEVSIKDGQQIKIEILEKLLKNSGFQIQIPSYKIGRKINEKFEITDPLVYVIYKFYKNEEQPDISRLNAFKIEKLNPPIDYDYKRNYEAANKLYGCNANNFLKDYFFDILFDVLNIIENKNKRFALDLYIVYFSMLLSKFYNDFKNHSEERNSNSKKKINGKDIPYIESKNLCFVNPPVISDVRADFLIKALRELRGSYDDNWLLNYQTHDIQNITTKYKLHEKGAYLAHEAGMGKSPIMCKFIKNVLEINSAARILIIVPASLQTQWKEQNLLDDFGITSNIITTESIKIDGLGVFNTRNVSICSIDTIKNIIQNHERNIIDISPDILIIDEAHILKNSNAQRFVEIKKLKPNFIVMASATPLQNNISEFLNQILIIDNNINLSKDETNIKKLRDKYVIRRTRKHDLAEIANIEQAKRSVELKEINNNSSFLELYTSLKEDFVENFYYYKLISSVNENSDKDLSKIMTFMLLQELSSSNEACYNGLLKIKNKIKNILEGIKSQENNTEFDFENLNNKEAKSIEKILNTGLTDSERNNLKNDLSLLNKYLEKTSEKYVLNDSKMNPKILELIKILGQYKSHSILIFVKYIATGKILAEILNNTLNYTAEFYNGTLKKDDRDRIINNFKSTTTKILICTDSANAGLNLQTADVLINYDLNWNPQVCEQRIGRIHRIGQRAEIVKIYNLVLKNSVDEHIAKIMNEKEEIFNAFFETSDDILGKIAKSYIDGTGDKLIEEMRNSQFNTTRTINIFDNDDEDTKRLNEDYYFSQEALKNLLMWTLSKHDIKYYTKDDKKYYLKANGKDTKTSLIELSETYNIIKDESKFFIGFSTSPFYNLNSSEYEDIEKVQFVVEMQERDSIYKKLPSLNLDDDLKNELFKILEDKEITSLMLLNLKLMLKIDDESIQDNVLEQNQAVLITNTTETHFEQNLIRLFYIFDSTVENKFMSLASFDDNSYNFAYEKILPSNLVYYFKKEKKIDTNFEISKITIYNGTIINLV